MLTAPQKINTIIDVNFKCLHSMVREENRGQSRRANKHTKK